MRKIINSSYLTLDGVVDSMHTWPALPHGYAPEHADVQLELLEQCEIVLMGRRTYDSFAAAWPARSDPYADRINRMRKVVASSSLGTADWENTEVVADGLAARLAELKAEDGGHIVQYGIGPVTSTLVREGLLDELHLWMFPQFVKGTPHDLAFDPEVQLQFELLGTRVLSNGVVVLSYAALGS